MSLGRFGSLLAFAVTAIGAGIIVFYPAAGLILILIGVAVLIGTVGYALYSNWKTIRAQAKRLGTPQIILLAAIAGTWLFITVGFGAAAWILWTQQGFAIGSSAIGVGAKQDDGPLQWVYSFSLEGGFGKNVFSLTFRGANTSKTPVQIKEANIISLIDGTLLPLEIIGVDPKTDENKIVPIDKVQLIIPGATIELVAKFGPPDPANPGKILGLDQKTFLEKWRQFSFNVKDDTRSYKLDFNENSMMPFFRGKVGPRVMIKPDGH